jgi:hypothetical protein
MIYWKMKYYDKLLLENSTVINTFSQYLMSSCVIPMVEHSGNGQILAPIHFFWPYPNAFSFLCGSCFFWPSPSFHFLLNSKQTSLSSCQVCISSSIDLHFSLLNYIYVHFKISGVNTGNCQLLMVVKMFTVVYWHHWQPGEVLHHLTGIT